MPDAVIKLDPGSGRLTREMEMRLAAVAAKAREDERIMLRLESYVPDGGSPSLNLVRAEQSLQQVRKRLVDLDINPRRISWRCLARSTPWSATSVGTGWIST